MGKMQQNPYSIGKMQQINCNIEKQSLYIKTQQINCNTGKKQSLQQK